MDINFWRASTPRESYGVRVWGIKSLFQDHHVSPEAKPCPNFLKKFETIPKGYGIAIARFQEIPWGYVCVLNHRCWGAGNSSSARRTQCHDCNPSSEIEFGRLLSQAISADAWHFRDILSKGGTLSYNEVLRFNFTFEKIRVYVLDSLDTIPKKVRG